MPLFIEQNYSCSFLFCQGTVVVHAFSKWSEKLLQQHCDIVMEQDHEQTQHQCMCLLFTTLSYCDDSSTPAN